VDEANMGAVIVGLADNAVKESMQRIESTYKCIGKEMARTRVVLTWRQPTLKRAAPPLTCPLP
jgi:magnesium chelatase family protein